MFALSVCCVIPNRFRRLAEAMFRGHGGEVFDAEKVHGDTPVCMAFAWCVYDVSCANQCHSIKPVIDISLVCISPVILGHGSCEIALMFATAGHEMESEMRL